MTARNCDAVAAHTPLEPLVTDDAVDDDDVADVVAEPEVAGVTAVLEVLEVVALPPTM